MSFNLYFPLGGAILLQSHFFPDIAAIFAASPRTAETYSVFCCDVASWDSPSIEALCKNPVSEDRRLR